MWLNTAVMRDGEPGSDDPFRPPDIPTEVECIHCGEEYESYLIRWVPNDERNPDDGFWCCPTPGCDGVGFCFDIFPTDPDWRDENGHKVWCDFDEDEDSPEGEESDEDFEEGTEEDSDDEEAEWSPEWEQAMYGDDADEWSESEDSPLPGDDKRPPEPPLNEDDIPF